MADRPIIFSAPMVRALLREAEAPGTGKTQTRRVLKPQPKVLKNGIWYRPYPGTDPKLWAYLHGDRVAAYATLPYAPGDLLYVREACWFEAQYDHLAPRNVPSDSAIFYAADPFETVSGIDVGSRYRHARFMPRWASRLTLTVTEVRAQRLQDISRGDAMDEGCPFANMADGPNPIDWYRTLWNSLHGPDAWEANPWVPALTFTVSRRNIDAVRHG